jgi:hypothetical protein
MHAITHAVLHLIHSHFALFFVVYVRSMAQLLHVIPASAADDASVPPPH